MNGIPDPGRASKAVEIVTTAAPFDAIRNVTLEGREFWSARDLMSPLGYTTWENFAEAISRAKVAAHNSGHDVAQNFPGATKVTGSRGPAAQDYHLSRYACYLVALNGDPRKPEIAAAQTYFVIKAREAEVAAAPAVMPSHSEALRGWAEQLERAELAESRARELAVPASAWNELAEAAGDYSVADAAKVLSRDPNISTGQNRLFKFMHAEGWIFRSRPGTDGWCARQSQVENGRLVEKVNKPYYHQGRDEVVAPAPTIRITPKGLQELHHRLGGGGAQMTLAVAE